MITIHADSDRRLPQLVHELQALNGGLRAGIGRAPLGQGIRVSDELAYRWLQTQFESSTAPPDERRPPANKAARAEWETWAQEAHDLSAEETAGMTKAELQALAEETKEG